MWIKRVFFFFFVNEFWDCVEVVLYCWLGLVWIGLDWFGLVLCSVCKKGKC